MLCSFSGLLRDTRLDCYKPHKHRFSSFAFSRRITPKTAPCYGAEKRGCVAFLKPSPSALPVYHSAIVALSPFLAFLGGVSRFSSPLFLEPHPHGCLKVLRPCVALSRFLASKHHQSS